LIDVQAHSLTIASAGHISPLLVDNDRGEYVKSDVNVPIGVPRDFDYQETTVSVPARATLVAFTDGLVERRTEILDTGLARLRDVATTGERLAPDDLVEMLTRDLASKDHNDDTAIVVIQWET
jgi:serine phosphatase RsbU (regulator of sigma subunit)